MCLEQYIGPLVNELKVLMATGISDGNTIRKIRISSFICDAPAKAFLFGTKSHNGYYACSKCVVKGKYVENRTVLLKVDAALRNDESFRNQSQPQHHLGVTPLQRLDIDMVTSVPLDYMHLVCLGVMRKLLKLWTNGPRAPYRLRKNDIDWISGELETYRTYFPREFGRKTRSLIELDRWKATEFRTFLLYVGPIVLKNRLDNKYFNHFLVLNVAIKLLCQPKQSVGNIDYANNLLVYFVREFITLYGRKFCSYNVHGLVHLAADVKFHGNLDQFAAFKFESFLGSMKRLINSPKIPIKQVVSKLLMQQEMKDSIAEKKSVIQYKSLCGELQVKLNGMTFSPSFPDNIVAIPDGRIAKILNITRQGDAAWFTLSVFLTSTDWFDTPCQSSYVGVYKIKFSESSPPQDLQFSSEFRKCIGIRYKSDKFVIHTLLEK